jgi:DNA replication protein DnaC
MNYFSNIFGAYLYLMMGQSLFEIFSIKPFVTAFITIVPVIIDDFGLQSFDTQTRQAVMDIIEDRDERASTIITAQIQVQQWYQAIGEGTISDAILDRFVYSSHRIEGRVLKKK